MPLYRITDDRLQTVPDTTFAAENFRERQDLQRLIRNDISVLGDDLKIIKEEFSNWQDSARRIDLLCIDSQARLVVVELKRTIDGGHMELQAIRYAAMVSSTTFAQVADVYGRNMNKDAPDAKAELLSFLGWEVERELNTDVRIILVSADFSPEITTTVLWLNKRGLDITCFKARPYRLDAEMLIDIQQIIPLPEAADYEVKVRALEEEKQNMRAAYEANWSGIWYVNVGEDESRSWEDMRKYGFIAAGGGWKWINPLKRLRLGEEFYAYQKSRGYVGYGTVTSEAVPVSDFRVGGALLSSLPVNQRGLFHDIDNPEKTEWLVGVQWIKSLPLSEAKTFPKVFANQASVCRLTQINTLNFLKASFQDSDADNAD